MRDERLEKLANLIVDYAAPVKKGDMVHVKAKLAATPFIEAVSRAVIDRGAHLTYSVALPSIQEYLIKNGSDEQLLMENPYHYMINEKSDVIINAWGTENTRNLSNVDPARQSLAGKASARAFKLFMQRYADKKMVWCGTQFPTHADAQEASMSLTEFEDFVYASCFLDHDDPIAKWKEVEREQEIWCKWFTGKSEYHVIAPGTDLKIRSDKRLWVNCCGHENMPDGEIFTSPVEDSANGHITFSFPGIFNGHEIENIRLEIRDGKVVEATASRGEAILKSLLATDEGASRFGEFAIGQNYAIKNNTKNMLFDEKIGGTIHLAVGAGMPECSSTNESAIHWDMLCDMREGGRLYADGQLCYENGKLLESVL